MARKSLSGNKTDVTPQVDTSKSVSKASAGIEAGSIAAIEALAQTNTKNLHGPTIKSAGYETPLRGLIDQVVEQPSRVPAAQRTRDTAPGSRTAEPHRAKLPAPSTLAPIDSVTDIGTRVKKARKDMGMTQQRFADLAGVGRRFLIELEHGKQSLEIGRVLAVCHAAGLKIGFAP